MKKSILFVLLAFCSNFSSAMHLIQPATNTTPVVTNTATMTLNTNFLIRVVAVGLTKVNPAAYNGWDGDCPGTDIDCANVVKWFKGCEMTILTNQQATRNGFRDAIAKERNGLGSNDLLVVALSGHGGQVDDTNGDEADGIDETICLWDGQVVDDDVLDMVCLPGNYRLLLITDTCFSEGNFRFWRTLARKATFGWCYPVRSGPMRVLRPRVTDGPAWGGQLIQLSAARENQSAEGAADGGVFTTQTLGKNRKAGQTLTNWFSASRVMPNQEAAWSEYGDVQESFRRLVLWGTDTNKPPVVVPTNTVPSNVVVVVTNTVLPKGKLCGYFPPHKWNPTEAPGWFAQMNREGLNCIMVEYLNEVNANWTDAKRREWFTGLVNAAKPYPITLVFSIIHGAGQSDLARGVHSSRARVWKIVEAKGVPWYENEVKWLWANVGMGNSNLVASPLMEIRSGQESWVSAFERQWKGRKCWNGSAGRPTSLPAGYEFLEYHQTSMDSGADVAKYGNKTLYNTDDGILSTLQNGNAEGPANLDQVEKWMRKWIPGNSVSYYPYLAPYDSNVVSRMGNVLRSMYPPATSAVGIVLHNRRR